MSRMHGMLLTTTLALLGALLGAGAGRAASTILLPRAGQVGVGIQGEYGTLLDNGALGQEFGSGPGLAVHLRYRMRFERALGLSFASESFDVRTPADSLYADKQLTVLLSGAEVYQMFGTRTRTTKMLSAGAGIAQTRVKLRDGEIVYPGDGLYLSAGAGLERFFFRSWAFDATAHYNAVFIDGKVNHDVQAALGLIFYASY